MSSMTKSVTIVGGGFRGMIGAYLCRKKGFEVTLVEKAPFLGGIMYSQEWNGFFVDNGVHLFDSIPRNLGSIIEEVMDGNVVNIDFNYASVYNDRTTRGLAIPDLSNLSKEIRSKILFEVVEKLAETPSENPKCLYDKLFDLYGPTAADLLDASMHHIYGASTRELETDSLRQTAYHRLRFLKDEMTLELKKHPVLDDRLAAMRVNIGKVDDFVSLYPSVGGMRGFCIQMKTKLEEMGVKIMTKTLIEDIHVESGVHCILAGGEKLSSDNLLWGQDYGLLAKTWKKDDRIANLVHGTPMVVFHFSVNHKKVHDYTYFHQFTPGKLVFRSAAAGVYGNQIKEDGSTYVSVECPVKIGSEFWENPEKFVDAVWKECVDMDLLDEGTPTPKEYTFFKAPITHRYPKVGTSELCDELDMAIESSGGAIVMPKRQAFTRREIMWVMEEAIEKLMAS